jgi:SAM-dependent methyltransferase
MGSVCCSVCGSCCSKPYLEEGNFTVVRCRECGHLYTSPLPDTVTVAECYTASGNWIKPTDIAVPSGADNRFLQYAVTLERTIAPKAKIIEIGCSKGRFLHLLQQRGFDCYGVEPSRDAEIASQLLGADRIWHAFYAQLLPFAADAVTMFEVLEHIPEPHKTAAMIFEQLCPGGYFMGSVPNGTFIRAKVWPRRKLGLRSLGVPLIMDAGNHINYFSSHGIQAMLERVGFEFIWIKNAPLDFNYSANRLSPLLKRLWQILTLLSGVFTGNLLGSNIWFLARRPR